VDLGPGFVKMPELMAPQTGEICNSAQMQSETNNQESKLEKNQSKVHGKNSTKPNLPKSSKKNNFEPKYPRKPNEGVCFVHTEHHFPVIDFDCNSMQPWQIASISENQEHEYSGGGLLQIFKPLDLLCMGKREAILKINATLSEFNAHG
jgi:hypothetical protein